MNTLIYTWLTMPLLMGTITVPSTFNAMVHIPVGGQNGVTIWGCYNDLLVYLQQGGAGVRIQCAIVMYLRTK